MTIRFLDLLTQFLLIVAGVVCGLLAFDIPVVVDLSGDSRAISVTAYVILGAAAAYQLVQWRAIRKRIKTK